MQRVIWLKKHFVAIATTVEGWGSPLKKLGLQEWSCAVEDWARVQWILSELAK